jgi:ATP-dependent DNA helicase RecG
MEDLSRVIDDLVRRLQSARRAGWADLAPVGEALETAIAAAGAAGVDISPGDLPETVRLWPRLGEPDRQLVAARLQRIAATLCAHVAARLPAAEEPQRRVPGRAERALPEGDPLSLPVGTVRGVGEKTTRLLAARGIETVGDLLRLMPRAYEDRRQGGAIGDLRVGQPGFALGTIARASWSGFGRSRRFRLEVSDETGTLSCVWFRAHRGMQRFARGERVRVSGTPRVYQEHLEMHHPDISLIEDDEEGGPGALPIVPRYPEIEGVPRRTVWRLVRQALDLAAGAADPLPASVRAARGLPDLAAALAAVHTPAADADAESLNALRHPAQRRLIFEELFALQLALARAARDRQTQPGIRLATPGALAGRLRGLLSFTLTNAQERAVAEIAADLRRDAPMSRLLQGDVGSGKTLVALSAALFAIEAGYQAAVLAPTEVLAEQHHATMGGLAARLGLSTALVTSSLTGARRRAVREEIRSGLARLVIGTQALLYEAVEFDALGLCVVDEQHRFGVLQRAALTAKAPAGLTPHLLVMTATPIPRTLAMTVYGDLSVSLLDEKPPGREPVETRLFRGNRRGEVFDALRRAVDGGAQAYVILPLVEASEALAVRDAVRTHAELSEGALAGIPVGLLHGRMSAEEKRSALDRFHEGADRVLVCTTVVEVGVDVPAATVLVVEHADRFGLAQLHQLRGRVGRGGGKSHALLLLGEDAGPDAVARLRILTETDDGFRIAEEDLRLRGPGEILGTLQAGRPALFIADLVRDAPLLQQAREAAFALVEADPDFRDPEHVRSWEMLAARYGPLLHLLRAA